MPRNSILYYFRPKKSYKIDVSAWSDNESHDFYHVTHIMGQLTQRNCRIFGLNGGVQVKLNLDIW